VDSEGNISISVSGLSPFVVMKEEDVPVEYCF
jgi:hypothetical protein